MGIKKLPKSTRLREVGVGSQSEIEINYEREREREKRRTEKRWAEKPNRREMGTSQRGRVAGF